MAECAFGCREQTAGGTFRPGHDSYLRAEAERRAGGRDSSRKASRGGPDYKAGNTSLEEFGDRVKGSFVTLHHTVLFRTATPSYSINVTLDGCCDHRAMLADEDLHRHAIENLDRADALLFGRVTYEMMEAGWRRPAQAGARPDWMEPFARTIDAAKKCVGGGSDPV